jgi:hypothetical protein
MLSKGIRIYFHCGDRRVSRENYNTTCGQDIVDGLMQEKDVVILAMGSEEGAMAFHYTRNFDCV